MALFEKSLLIISVLSFTFHAFAQSIVAISDTPSVAIASANPATTGIFGGTLIISQDDTTDTTILTLDENLVAKVAYANGSTTEIQEALGYGYHNALSKKFISIPVLAIGAIIGYLAVLLSAGNEHLISVTNDITAVEPVKLTLSTADMNALAAPGPDPGILIVTEVGSGTRMTITMPPEAVATGSQVCPPVVRRLVKNPTEVLVSDFSVKLAADDEGCNAPPPQEFCPLQQKYEECECDLVYYSRFQVVGDVASLASGASVFSAMLAMSNAPSTSPGATVTGPLATSTSSVYGCPVPCCFFPQGAGAVAPFLTTTVAGTPTTNCAYTTTPSEDNCPPAAATTISTSPSPTSTHCTLSTDTSSTTWFACNTGGPYQVTSPGQVQADATAPFNCKTPAIQGWTSTIAIAPGCMCATTYGPIPTASIAQITSGGTSCNPSISSAGIPYSVSSLGSGGSGDGLAIPYCVISGTEVPQCTQTAAQCYGHKLCPEGDYIANGGTGHPSCA